MGNNKPWAFFWEINFLTSGLGQSTYLHRMDYAEWCTTAMHMEKVKVK